jgi:hypothetical protein
MRVFENRVLRRVFGLKREEVAGGWRRFHNLYASPNIVRVIASRSLRLAGHVAHMEEMRNVYKVLFGEREGKRPLGKPKRRWEDNIRTDLKRNAVIRCGLDSSGSRWRPMAGCYEPLDSIKGGYFLD